MEDPVINLITPPDKLYNDNRSFLLMNPSDIVKEQFKLMLASGSDNYEDLPSSSSFPEEKDNEGEGKENPFIPTSDSKTSKKSKTPVLDNFGRDITALAEQEKLDPVVGREQEIERMQIA